MYVEDENELLLRELSQQFREQWSIQCSPDYDSFLVRFPSSKRIDLLVKLIQDDMELSIQRTTQELASSEIHEDDRRVEPRLDLFLIRFPELRSSFEACRDLALFEFAVRRGSHQPLDIQHYLEILPEFAKQIHRDLIRTDEKLISTSLIPDRFEPSEPNDSTVPDAIGEPLQAWRLPKQLGNFQLLSMLGRGGMGTVFRALDLRTGGVCAVKVMRRTDSWSVFRFNEEFRALASLDHPNIARLFESYSDEGVRYFSMELVEGRDLKAWWTRRNTEDRWELLARVLWQIAFGLQFLHHRGITHGDIKPGNVLVTKRGRAVLLDLGLATFVDDMAPGQGSTSERLVGTLNYMAPEVVLGSHVTRESDWYSFGAVVWELIVGDPPELPTRGVQTTTKEPSEEDLNSFEISAEESKEPVVFGLLSESNAPEYLKELCVDLLQSDPALRPKAAAILERLRSVSQEFRFPPQSSAKTPFIGRHDEFQFLSKFAEPLDTDLGGRLILVNGEQGVGRTRLVDEWLRIPRMERSDFVIRVACNFQDAGPFRLVDSLVQAYVGHWKKRGLTPRATDENAMQIARGFPQFHEILNQPEPSSSALTENGVEGELAAAAAAFVRVLVETSREFPLLMSIDNAQWADDASLQKLVLLWTSDLPFQGTVIGIYDAPDISDPPPSRVRQNILPSIRKSMTPPRVGELSLQPLSSAESAQLASVMLTQPGMPIQPITPLAAGFSEISRGNPKLLEEFIRSFHEADSSGETWLVKIEEMRGQDVDQFRFRRLKKESRQIVEYLSVARVPVSFQQLQIATRVGPELLFPYLGDLAAQNWIEWHGVWPDLRLGIYDSILQNRVRNWTDHECIQRRHARLAQSLALEVDKQWCEIAYHYAAAGKTRRAIDAFLEAASVAASQGDHEKASECLAQAESHSPLNRDQVSFAKEIASRLR